MNKAQIKREAEAWINKQHQHIIFIINHYINKGQEFFERVSVHFIERQCKKIDEENKQFEKENKIPLFTTDFIRDVNMAARDLALLHPDIRLMIIKLAMKEVF